MMTVLPTKEQIEASKRDTDWEFCNSILYNLCRENPDHKQKDRILAKVWLIGRANAAAIERRKNKKEDADDFFINVVVPQVNWPGLDKRLLALMKYKEITSESAPEILETHEFLTNELYKITKLNKRSFSSKYLHFHLPELFFIYDSRASGALRKFIRQVPKEMQCLTVAAHVDEEYAKFTCKCLELKRQISMAYDANLTSRQLDYLLLSNHNYFSPKRTAILLHYQPKH